MREGGTGGKEQTTGMMNMVLEEEGRNESVWEVRALLRIKG